MVKKKRNKYVYQATLRLTTNTISDNDNSDTNYNTIYIYIYTQYLYIDILCIYICYISSVRQHVEPLIIKRTENEKTKKQRK